MALFPSSLVERWMRTNMEERTHALPARFRYGSFLVRAVVIALVSVSVLGGGVLAHPPADAAMSYDRTTGDLIVTIAHQVDDPATHYVKQVTVTQGDTVLVDKSYTSQPDRSSATYRYNLPQLAGSSGEIRVNVQCSQFGSRSGTLTLSATPATGTAESTSSAMPPPTQSPAGACVALVAVGLVACRILR